MKKLFFLCFLLVSLMSADSWRDINELHRNLKGVHLSDDQEKEIKKLFKSYHRNLKEWWNDNEKIDTSIMQTFSSKSLDSAIIRDKLKVIQQRKADIDLKFLTDLHMILSQDQREKLSKEFAQSNYN